MDSIEPKLIDSFVSTVYDDVLYLIWNTPAGIVGEAKIGMACLGTLIGTSQDEVRTRLKKHPFPLMPCSTRNENSGVQAWVISPMTKSA